MASTINSYATLKNAIITWLDRADVSGNVPDFIALAEDHIRGDLRLLDTEQLLTLTFDPAVNPTVAKLPDDAISLRHITWQGTPLTDLTYLTPSQATWEYGQQTPGTPRAFTLAQGNIVLAAPVDVVTSVQILYTQVLPSLSDANQTNWLILRDASLYLYGSLEQSAPFLGDDARVQMWSAGYQRSLAEMALINERRKYGSSPLMIRVAWAP